MNSNDTMVLFSDGLIESENNSGEHYGVNGVINAMKTIAPELTSEAQLEYLKKDFNRFIGSSAIKDDLTLILLKKK